MNKWLSALAIIVIVEILVFGFPETLAQPQLIKGEYYDSDGVSAIVKREITNTGYQGYPVTSVAIESIKILDNSGDGMWSGSVAIFYKKPNGSARAVVSWRFYEMSGAFEID
jgi:hypothetical protein